MSKGLTAEQIAQISKIQVKTRILLTLTLRDEDDSIIRILENDTLSTFVYNGNTYITASVKRDDIESKIEGGPQKVNVRISNINQFYSNLIVSQGDVLTNSTCKIEEVIYFPPGFDELNLESIDAFLLEDGGYALLENNYIVGGAINIYEGYVNNIKLTASEFSFDVERILGGYSTQSPNTTFDVNCQWGFKDSRCEYSGIITTCDKTLTTCKNLSNQGNFGGYPSIPQELIIRK
jgi:phage-related protein